MNATPPTTANSSTASPTTHRRFGDAADRTRRMRAQRLAILTIATGWSIWPGCGRRSTGRTRSLRWMFYGHQPGKQFQMLAGLFLVYIASAIRALVSGHRKPAYRSTVRTREASVFQTGLALLPQLLLGANVVGPFYALWRYGLSPGVVAASVPVSALAIWSLSHVCCAAFDRRRWNAERHPVRFYASAVRQ